MRRRHALTLLSAPLLLPAIARAQGAGAWRRTVR
jgi:hypothetical protein